MIVARRAVEDSAAGDRALIVWPYKVVAGLQQNLGFHQGPREVAQRRAAGTYMRKVNRVELFRI